MNGGQRHMPKGYRVSVSDVGDGLYDCKVWKDGQLVLATSGTAFLLKADARACGKRRAWDIHNNKTVWS